MQREAKLYVIPRNSLLQSIKLRYNGTKLYTKLWFFGVS